MERIFSAARPRTLLTFMSIAADTLTTTVSVEPQNMESFAKWQTELNLYASKAEGFISLEITSLAEKDLLKWTIVQRFSSCELLSSWLRSSQYEMLKASLKKIVKEAAIKEDSGASLPQPTGVTEVFVTQVQPGQEAAFKEWAAKIHQIETRFHGFRGMYLQAPAQKNSHNWLSFLHFDTAANLDHWLNSYERKKILEESKQFISSLESHRVISSYAGWFASLEKQGALPSVCKQTMLVLLVLFPIVMGEIKFLSPWLTTWNASIATFIGNAISVTLIAWPMMPVALYFLDWWLMPSCSFKTNCLGFAVVIALYFLEIILMWNLI